MHKPTPTYMMKVDLQDNFSAAVYGEILYDKRLERHAESVTHIDRSYDELKLDSDLLGDLEGYSVTSGSSLLVIRNDPNFDHSKLVWEDRFERRLQYFVMKERSDKTHFNLPGGKIDKGETPVMALRRELKEEGFSGYLKLLNDSASFVSVSKNLETKQAAISYVWILECPSHFKPDCHDWKWVNKFDTSVIDWVKRVHHHYHYLGAHQSIPKFERDGIIYVCIEYIQATSYQTLVYSCNPNKITMLGIQESLSSQLGSKLRFSETRRLEIMNKANLASALYISSPATSKDTWINVMFDARSDRDFNDYGISEVGSDKGVALRALLALKTGIIILRDHQGSRRNLEVFAYEGTEVMIYEIQHQDNGALRIKNRTYTNFKDLLLKEFSDRILLTLRYAKDRHARVFDGKLVQDWIEESEGADLKISEKVVIWINDATGIYSDIPVIVSETNNAPFFLIKKIEKNMDKEKSKSSEEEAKLLHRVGPDYMQFNREESRKRYETNLSSKDFGPKIYDQDAKMKVKAMIDFMETERATWVLENQAYFRDNLFSEDSAILRRTKIDANISCIRYVGVKLNEMDKSSYQDLRSMVQSEAEFFHIIMTKSFELTDSPEGIEGRRKLCLNSGLKDLAFYDLSHNTLCEFAQSMKTKNESVIRYLDELYSAKPKELSAYVWDKMDGGADLDAYYESD
jgi:hypothetical protein